MSDTHPPRPQTQPQPRLEGDRPLENKGLGALDRASSLWWLLFVGLVAALLCAPFFRLVIFLGDEGILLREAELLLQGKRLYADFFQFLPPGTLIVIAAWFKIAGISFASARFLAILVIVGAACFTFLSCERASRSAPLSALLTTGWAMMSVWAWMQIGHHWFASLLSMATAWAALTSLEQPQRLIWPAIAGTTAGATAMFVPNAGAFVMFAAMTAFVSFRASWAPLIVYLLCCAFAPIGVLGYLLEQNTLAAAFDDVIRFTATHYTSVNFVPFGFGVSRGSLPLICSFLVAGLLALVVFVADWRSSLHDRRLWLCVAFALAGFLSCYPRPDFIHISYVVPLVLPLLALCIARLTESWRPIYRYGSAAIVIGLCAPSGYFFLQKAWIALKAEKVQTARGEVGVAGQYAATLAHIVSSMSSTPPEAGYFFYPYDAMLPFLTARSHVSKYDLFQPGYTPPTQYQEACRSMIERASWVVVDRLWTSDMDMWRNIFPSMPQAEPQETLRFNQALDGAFDLVSSSGKFDLRRRRDGVGQSVCDAITE